MFSWFIHIFLFKLKRSMENQITKISLYNYQLYLFVLILDNWIICFVQILFCSHQIHFHIPKFIWKLWFYFTKSLLYCTMSACLSPVVDIEDERLSDCRIWMKWTMTEIIILSYEPYQPIYFLFHISRQVTDLINKVTNIFFTFLN